ncbi:glycosyltransferase family 2 protein [candidate division CSSED10-310 bacterium]|uniref:Glycosyltransferase family 2 protein n=1 Tax=candidate division CSSED10-310 bacterium TaxID=2855610 RepID=A0ABV6Z1L6_UNCC1
MEAKMLPSIAVLVLNYNGCHFLRHCFLSLQKQTYPLQHVYLVDNNSSDGSVAYTRKHFPEVVIISLERNYGFAEAYNRAVAQVEEPFVVFLNNDTHCSPDWLERLYAPISENTLIAAAGSRMLFADHPEIINHGGGYFTLAGIGLDRDFGVHIDDPALPRQPFITAYACGGAMLINREIFLAAGGFDPEYFIYFEDVDLAFRIWMMGYSIVHVPNSVVFHYFSPVFGKESPAKLFLCQKNRLANIFKHFNFVTLARAIIVSLGYDLGRIVQWKRTRQINQIMAIIRGGLFFWGNLPRIIDQRRFSQKFRVRNDPWFYDKQLVLSLAASLKEMKRLKAVKEKLFNAS